MQAAPVVLRIETVDEHGESSITLTADGNELARESLPAAALLKEPTPATLRARLRAARPSEADCREIGRSVFDLIFRGDLRTEWKKVERAPLVLDILRRDLAMLPLEMMFDGRNFIFSSAVPVMRPLPGHDAGAHDSDYLPLRVLVVVGDEEKGTTDWQLEVAGLRRIFREMIPLIDWEILVRPTIEQLSSFTRKFRPHIFHFIGHGEFRDDEGDREPVLILSQEAGGEVEWSVAAMKEHLISDEWRIRMAVFNACRSAIADADELSWDFGHSFIEHLGGCCAVTMQGDIAGIAAAEFATMLYRMLARGKSIDVSVAEARRFVRQRLPEHPDWAFPVLQIGCAASDAVPVQFRIANDRVSEIARDFKDLHRFVDRAQERRDLWASIVHDDAPKPPSLFILHGERRLGKTWVARWLVRNSALHGHAVRSINLQDKSHGYGEVLEAIRRGSNVRWGFHQPLPPASFAAYEEARRENRRAPRTEDYIADLFEKFVTGLTACVGEHPLLIVLDGFEVKAAGERGGFTTRTDMAYMVRYLVKRVADHDVPNVRMLLVTTTREFEMGELAGFSFLARDVAVEKLPIQWLAPLAEESFPDFPLPEALKGYVADLKNELGQQSWSPEKFELLAVMHDRVREPR